MDSETQAKRVIIELKPRRLDERVLGFEGKGDWKGKVKAVLSLGFQESIRTSCGSQPSHGGGAPEGPGVKVLREFQKGYKMVSTTLFSLFTFETDLWALGCRNMGKRKHVKGCPAEVTGGSAERPGSLRWYSQWGSCFVGGQDGHAFQNRGQSPERTQEGSVQLTM